MNKPEPQPPLTDEQRSSLKPAFDKIEAGWTEFSSGLKAMGRRVPEPEEGNACFHCSCQAFVPRGRGPIGPESPCDRRNCGHSHRAHLT